MEDPVSAFALMKQRSTAVAVASGLDHTVSPSRTDSTANRGYTLVMGNRRTSSNGEQDDEDIEHWYQTWRLDLATQLRAMSRDDWLSTLFPCWSWLKYYQWNESFSADLMAGLTVGIMIIPQSMSYAKLAGLPVEFGLYTGLVPVYTYAVFGTSRQVSVGPVALVSLLLSTGISKILASDDGPPPDSPEYQTAYCRLAIQCSFLVGLIYVIVGLCRGGFITVFLSHAVISGFTTGAAVIIGLSQVKYLVGYDTGKADKLQEILKMLFEGIEQFNRETFVMGSLSIMMLLVLKHVGNTNTKFNWVRAAGPLLLTVVAVILTVALDLSDKGIPVVGFIPRGLPSITASQWTPIADFGKLFRVVVSIAVVGFMESIAIAKQLASKNKYEIDASRELVGLGMANLVGGAFCAYPVAGSFSRSAVNDQSGARSGISGVITATLVCIALLCLTRLFEKLPLNALAAVVISGVIGLLDYDEAFHLWKVHKLDFIVWCTACVGTMFAGTELGLSVAVGVSLLVVVYESAHPQTSVLGRLPGTSTYCNIQQYPEAEIYEGIVIVRIDGPLYFANAQKFRDMVSKSQLQAESDTAVRNGEIKFVILDMSPVSQIDSTALHQLEHILESVRSRGQELCIAGTSRRVFYRLEASGLAEKIGDSFFFSFLHDAVTYSLREMDHADRERSTDEDEHYTDNHVDEENAGLLDSETADAHVVPDKSKVDRVV